VVLELFNFRTWKTSNGRNRWDYKRTADSIVLHGQDVTTAKDLIENVQPLRPKIKLIEVSDDQINKWKSYLPESLPPLKGIQKVHQILWQKHYPQAIEIRSLSCQQCMFKFCKHFKLVEGLISFEGGSAKTIPFDIYSQIVTAPLSQSISDDLQSGSSPCILLLLCENPSSLLIRRTLPVILKIFGKVFSIFTFNYHISCH